MRGMHLYVGFPIAATVPYSVISNFVAPLPLVVSSDRLTNLVTVGNLLPPKNHRFLLQVLAEAKRAGRSLTLDVFGDGPCRKDLVRQATSLRLEDQVRFGGFRRDVREFLRRYRAYVHASYSESSSLAIIEAMAAGLPIAAGYLKPLAELCDDGIEVRFLPLDNATEAAAKLIDFLDNEAALQKAAQAARDRYHRDFDADLCQPRRTAPPILPFRDQPSPTEEGPVRVSPSPAYSGRGTVRALSRTVARR